MADTENESSDIKRARLQAQMGSVDADSPRHKAHGEGHQEQGLKYKVLQLACTCQMELESDS